MHTSIVLPGLLSTADNLVWGYYLILEVIIRGYYLDNNPIWSIEMKCKHMDKCVEINYEPCPWVASNLARLLIDWNKPKSGKQQVSENA